MAPKSPRRPRRRPKPRGKARAKAATPDIRALRSRLQLTQRAFADFTRVPLRTVLGWEYKLSTPPPASAMFLRLLAHQPMAMARLIKSLPP